MGNVEVKITPVTEIKEKPVTTLKPKVGITKVHEETPAPVIPFEPHCPFCLSTSIAKHIGSGTICNQCGKTWGVTR